MMKKQYAQIIILAILLLSLVGSIMRCQQRGDAPSKETIEAPDSIEIADSTETVDSALQVQTARRYFEALTKMADGGKVYATDAEGQRIQPIAKRRRGVGIVLTKKNKRVASQLGPSICEIVTLLKVKVRKLFASLIELYYLCAQK